MKLTPLEIRKADFRRTLRGFEVQEVRIFLDMVAGEYEKLLQENGMLSEKTRHLSERLDEYHNLEKTLQNSILTAERIAAESHERTRREAESVIEDARVRGERILEDARERLRRLSREIQELRSQKDLFVSRFQSMLASQVQLLETQQGELDQVDTMDAHASSLIAGNAVTPPRENLVGEAPVGGAAYAESEAQEPSESAAVHEPAPPESWGSAEPEQLRQEELTAAEPVPIPPDGEEFETAPEEAEPGRPNFFRGRGQQKGFFRPDRGEGSDL